MNIVSIAAFMKRKIKSLRYCDRYTLLTWLNWYAARGWLAYVEKDGKLLSAGVARPVNETILGLMDHEFKTVRDQAHYLNDPKSGMIYVEQSASNSPQALVGIVAALKNRFPHAQEIIFRRKSGAWKIKKYKLNRFMKLCMKLNLESVG